MNTIEKMYEVLRAEKPNLSKREFSEQYLEMSSGYMTAMKYYKRDASLKALANLRDTLGSELNAWRAVHATHNTERTRRNVEKAEQLHALATETLLDAV